MVADAEKKNLITPGKVISFLFYILNLKLNGVNPLKMFILSDNIDRANFRKYGNKYGFHGGYERVQNNNYNAFLHQLGEESDYEIIWCTACPH